MQSITFQSRIPAPASALFAWHERPGAFQRLTPPWAPVSVKRMEGIRDGQQAVIRLGYGPASVEWVAEHHSYIEGAQFADTQLKGPFAAWDHVHKMVPAEDETSFIIDDITYRLPLGPLGQAVGGRAIRSELKRQFAYRHRVTQADLELHQRYNAAGRSLRVAVTGASGLVGSALTALLTTGGHEVVRLVRRPAQGPDEVQWSVQDGFIEAEKLEGLDALIHLAGENVFALRWTAAKKARILRSRADGTRLLAETLAGLQAPPGAFLSASAIGYYGDHGAQKIFEDAAPRDAGFLSEVCVAWEEATAPAVEAGIRTALMRIGVVLTPSGGALQLMLPPFQLGLGGAIGPLKQYLSWITLDDLVGAIYHLLWTDVAGPVNMTAPEPTTMHTYAKTLGRVLRRPAVLNVPSVAVKSVMGEAADEILLQSARVIPQQLLDTGYAFQYPDLQPGLAHLLGKTLKVGG